jgi:hypothetical protein
MAYDKVKSFSSLNPIYSIEDLKEVESMELNHFSAEQGLSSEILKKGGIYYSENPKNEISYVRQIDNITPVSLS